MNYEEKYKEALENLRKIKESNKDNNELVEFIECKFPELKESKAEWVEKIRKELKDYLGKRPLKKLSESDAVNQWIYWIEKQCEKKPALSEDDEKIRKAIHIYLDWLDGRNKDYQPKGDYTIRDMIAWLENQSHWKPTEEQLQTLHTQLNEGAVTYPDDKRVLTTLYEDLMKITTQEEKKNWQKPADKVEPKFKVGDWILYSGDHYEGVRHITKINENGYYIERNGLPHGIIPFNHEICMRLWTIKDAKDGDVLATKKGNPFIYDKNRYNNGLAYYYVGLDVNKELKLKGPHYILSHFGKLSSIFPATKEQRDVLFQKMKEFGYEWDAENKELKKIEQNMD